MKQEIISDIRADALRLVELARKDEKLAAELEKIALAMLRRAHKLARESVVLRPEMDQRVP
jgi:hypothetical protein